MTFNPPRCPECMKALTGPPPDGYARPISMLESVLVDTAIAYDAGGAHFDESTPDWGTCEPQTDQQDRVQLTCRFGHHWRAQLIPETEKPA